MKRLGHRPPNGDAVGVPGAVARGDEGSARRGAHTGCGERRGSRAVARGRSSCQCLPVVRRAMNELPSAADCLRDEDVCLLLAGGEGRDVEALRAHLDACEACQDLVAVASSADEVVIRDGDTILDRYRVVGELGRGAMGTVYRVHDPKLHRELAIKILHSADPSAPLRLEREAQSLARLSHPNIVTVFDIGGLRDQICMVMELVDGRSLRVWLEGAHPREAILNVFRRAAEGLHAAHRAGLVHRDFKPENVLVCEDGRVKIVDFGLAAADIVPAGAGAPSAARLAHSSALHQLTRTGVIVGTPAYMAPEQFRGLEGDARSDQFSFAVCMWEALHGVHPFQAQTIGELRHNIERGPAGAPGARALDGVTKSLLRALSIDPGARFASMEELVRELGEEARARPRLRVASRLVALALGALAVGAAFVLVARGARDDRAPPSVAPETTARAALHTLAPRPAASPPPPELAPGPSSTVSSIEADDGARPAPRVRPPSAGSEALRPASVGRVTSPPKGPHPSSVAAPTGATSSPLARGPNGAPLIE